MTLTDPRSVLSQMQERCDKATPGPWYDENPDDSWCMNAVVVTTAPCGKQLLEPPTKHPTIVAATLLQRPVAIAHASWRWDEDAAFIAAARTDLPKCIRALEAVLALCDEDSSFEVAVREAITRELESER